MFLEFELPSTAPSWRITVTGTAATPQRYDLGGTWIPGYGAGSPQIPIGLKIAAANLSLGQWELAVGDIFAPALTTQAGAGGAFGASVTIPGGKGTSLYLWYAEPGGHPRAVSIFAVTATPAGAYKVRPATRKAIFS